jgi:hypothetical protein
MTERRVNTKLEDALANKENWLTIEQYEAKLKARTPAPEPSTRDRERIDSAYEPADLQVLKSLRDEWALIYDPDSLTHTVEDAHIKVRRDLDDLISSIEKANTHFFHLLSAIPKRQSINRDAATP